MDPRVANLKLECLRLASGAGLTITAVQVGDDKTNGKTVLDLAKEYYEWVNTEN